ncbi:MAG: RNA-protein complex protein Nop10 [Candidatus Bathyarchaeota archaeon]|nr:RNA-protein complex protein Nop10 [Candidatus Bathyarchaeota archaeon]
MVWLLRRCERCAQYTLKDTCSCGGVAKSPHPAKFSMDDRYRKYRLLMRRMAAQKTGDQV